MRKPWKPRDAQNTWPVELRDDSALPAVVLRPLRVDDEEDWHQVRRENESFVRPWEPTMPPGTELRAPVSFRQFVREFDNEALAGRTLPWVIEVAGEIVGQVHIFGIVRGGEQSAAAGYWLAEAWTRRGIASRALALAIDYCLGPAGLHRVEVNIRVDNAASLGVVRKLGLRDEGIRERYLHIDGQWRDHRSFAVTKEEVEGTTVLSRVSQP
ncbi:MAG TPA: GNAT family protein [Dermatophilaceae bacterium]|nr:GNAT family protein [Dermatophilaceae bacterium]